MKSFTMPFAGSPVEFFVDTIASGHVTAHGPGLVTGRVNQPAYFTIVTKDAGAGTVICLIIFESIFAKSSSKFL